MTNYIYLTLNTVTGQHYIGRHTGTLIDGYLGSGVKLRRLIREFGIDNFKKVILEDNVSLRRLSSREKYWIDAFDSTTSKCGLNVYKGGNGPSVKNTIGLAMSTLVKSKYVVIGTAIVAVGVAAYLYFKKKRSRRCS